MKPQGLQGATGVLLCCSDGLTQLLPPLPSLRRSDGFVGLLGARNGYVLRCCCSLSCLDTLVVRPACAMRSAWLLALQTTGAERAVRVPIAALIRPCALLCTVRTCTHARAGDRSSESAYSRCRTRLDTPPCMLLTGRGQIRCCCVVASCEREEGCDAVFCVLAGCGALRLHAAPLLCQATSVACCVRCVGGSEGVRAGRPSGRVASGHRSKTSSKQQASTTNMF